MLTLFAEYAFCGGSVTVNQHNGSRWCVKYCFFTSRDSAGSERPVREVPFCGQSRGNKNSLQYEVTVVRTQESPRCLRRCTCMQTAKMIMCVSRWYGCHHYYWTVTLDIAEHVQVMPAVRTWWEEYFGSQKDIWRKAIEVTWMLLQSQ